MAIWQVFARLPDSPDWDMAIWKQSGKMSIWQPTVWPVWQHRQSGRNNSSVSIQSMQRNSRLGSHLHRLSMFIGCPTAWLARLPDCSICPIGQTEQLARLARQGLLPDLHDCCLPDCSRLYHLPDLPDWACPTAARLSLGGQYIYYSLLKELLQFSLGGAWAAAWAEGLGGSLGGLSGAWAEAWASNGTTKLHSSIHAHK